MRRLQSVLLAVLAALVLGVLASSAQAAETAPYFTVGGTRLIAGKTHNADSRVYAGHSFTLTNSTSSLVITCEALGTENVVLLGSNFGNPGKGNGIGVFSRCALDEGNGAPECKLESPVIKTFPMTGELVENVVNSKGGKQLLKELRPTNPGEGFADLHFVGEGCTITETVVSGQVVGEVRLDTAGEGPIELGQTPIEATSLLLRFPSTSVTQVWLISNGVGKIQKTKQISFGTQSVQTGTTLALLAGTKFEPEPNAQWSALP
jgi:hypothetical protein